MAPHGINGFSWDDLYDHGKLTELAGTFDRFLNDRDAELFRRFDAYRTNGGLTPPDESALLIAVSRHLGVFLTRLFEVEPGVESLKQRAERDAEVARFKKEFVAKRVAKVSGGQAILPVPGPPLDTTDPELELARTANRLLDLQRDNPASEEVRTQLDELTEWTAAKWKEGAFHGWTSFRLPQKIDFDQLVPTERVDGLRFGGDHHHFRRRDGFGLTDPRMTPREIADESAYCIYCHERKKDSCSRGFPQPNGT